MKTLTLAIVIPVYNEEDHLKVCLDALMCQTIQPDEIIVVDNNCTDRSAMVAAAFPGVRIVKAPLQGIAHARDAGFDAVRSDLIARIDADTLVPDTWVEQVHAAYRQRQDFALTGGCYFYNVPAPRVNGWVTSQLVYRLNRFIMGHYVLWGSNMVLTRKHWQQIRGTTCKDRDDIHEDLDLAIHLHRKNIAISYMGELRVGVEMKRVYNTPGAVHKARMAMWPNTLYAHQLRRAWLGKVGAWILYHGRHTIRLSSAVVMSYRRINQHLSVAWSKPD